MEEDTFVQLPLRMDPQTKAISASSPSIPLQKEIDQVNALHRSIISLDTPGQTPPPPVPVHPKRSAQITKLRESGNTSYKKGQHGDAVRMYSLAIDMALQRPTWEPSGLVREELTGLYSNRAQAYMAMQNWAEGAVDAETSVELKKVGNAKAWWRRGRCLVEMGRAKEAKEWVRSALEFEPQESDLLSLDKEVDALLARGKSD
ncbi:tetratricopeptide repeat domain-containing protein [Phyllosticta citrichinensis]|uniref:Tetratricopeptide repeat domain-containing protein n=1 Tax=Phyllosticta citrichinensis TaxID=1130410 RepID=A0ABR1XGT2_9PEZI